MTSKWTVVVYSNRTTRRCDDGRSVERPDNVLYADVRAQHQSQHADDDQEDVLPQDVFERTKVPFGPKDADLDQGGERDSQHGQAQGAE